MSVESKSKKERSETTSKVFLLLPGEDPLDLLAQVGNLSDSDLIVSKRDERHVLIGEVGSYTKTKEVALCRPMSWLSSETADEIRSIKDPGLFELGAAASDEIRRIAVSTSLDRFLGFVVKRSLLEIAKAPKRHRYSLLRRIWPSNDEAEFLFEGSNIPRWFFSRQPLGLWVGLTLFAILTLVLPAHWLGLGSIPHPSADGSIADLDNHGFFYSPGWCFMLVILLPIILALCARVAKLVRPSLELISDDAVRVVPPTLEKLDFIVEFRRRIYERRTHAWGIAFCLAALITGLDWANVQSMRNAQWHTAVLAAKNGESAASAPKFTPYWDNAYRVANASATDAAALQDLDAGRWSQLTKRVRVSFVANWLFIIYAYLYEFCGLYLGIFFAVKFRQFIRTFNDLVLRRSSPFTFQPLIYDVHNRLGLHCLGRIFTLFMWAILLFQLNVLFLRLELISKANHNRWFVYPDLVWNQWLDLQGSGWKDPLRVLSSPELVASSSLQVDLATYIIGMFVLVLLVAVFPLFHLRRFVERARDQVWKAEARKYDQLMSSGDEDSVRTRRRLLAIQQADTWPNGQATAYRQLFLSGALMLGALLPPLLIGLFFLGVAGSAYVWLANLRPLQSFVTQSGNPAPP